jgi:hypothetical protein
MKASRCLTHMQDSIPPDGYVRHRFQISPRTWTHSGSWRLREVAPVMRSTATCTAAVHHSAKKCSG